MKLLTHGWQSKPNPNQTTATVYYHQAEQSYGEKNKKTKSKKNPRSSFIFTGLLSPSAGG